MAKNRLYRCLSRAAGKNYRKTISRTCFRRAAKEVHLTIVMAAMALGKAIKAKTSVSSRQFVKTLRPIRSGVIVLLASQSLANHAIAQKLSVGRPTVLLWRNRFAEKGTTGIKTLKRQRDYPKSQSW